ncbi:aspartate/glutamate racemase family protein [Rhodococcus sp. T7]|uniref:aspartate/glutamate racemase family protein n=1 Tax=Rhodococcus sp. T7 TaxID=627444 RepID=UPI00135AC8A4|nr:aspartate/glutamate racemase family protein [Rhodococcus sp. T7]KAF0964728.1 Hydantoin racemase [Rhodococcus sp. T7]
MKLRVLLVNPNTTAAMTRMIEDATRRVPGVDALDITAVNPEVGPAAIETEADEQVAVESMLGSAHRWAAEVGFDTVVVSCFRDPGVDELRALTGIPVHGIAFHAMLAAQDAGGRFSIVCAMPSAVELMIALADRYGFGDALVSVRAVEMSVLDIARSPEAAADAVLETVRLCVDIDGAEAACLGCAAMSPLAAALDVMSPIPVIDSVGAAVETVLKSVVSTGWGGGHPVIARFDETSRRRFACTRS